MVLVVVVVDGEGVSVAVEEVGADGRVVGRDEVGVDVVEAAVDVDDGDAGAGDARGPRGGDVHHGRGGGGGVQVPGVGPPGRKIGGRV